MSVDNIEIGTGALARLLDITSQRVGQLVAAGILRKVGRGRFKLDEAVGAYVRFLRGQPTGTDGAGAPLDYATERARLTRLQADRLELDLAEAEKRSAPISEIAEEIGREYTALRSQLLVIATKTAPLLAAEASIAACHRIVFEAVVAALTELTMDATTAASAEKLNERTKGDDDA
ncbi:MAG: hypothetical protein AB7O63_13155 [Reyranellaceae bacterium]